MQVPPRAGHPFLQASSLEKLMLIIARYREGDRTTDRASGISATRGAMIIVPAHTAVTPTPKAAADKSGLQADEGALRTARLKLAARPRSRMRQEGDKKLNGVRSVAQREMTSSLAGGFLSRGTLATPGGL